MKFIKPNIRQYTGFMVVFWLILVGVLAFLVSKTIDEEVNHHILANAQSISDNEMSYRLLNISHGGFYTSITDKHHPDPLLSDLKHRDIETKDGHKLTLLSATHMTLHAGFLNINPLKPSIRVIYLNSKNSERMPDSWEEKGLKYLKENENTNEFHQFVSVEGKEYLKFLTRFNTSLFCMECSSDPGLNEEDFLGGLSITIPKEIYQNDGNQEKLEIFGFGSIAVIFVIILILLSGYLLNKKIKNIEEINHKLLVVQKEKHMAGGFAHEMRNALTGGSLLVENALEIDDADENISLPGRTIKLAQQLFDRIENKTDKELSPILDTIKSDQQLLDDTLKIVQKDFNKGKKIVDRIMSFVKLNELTIGSAKIDLSQILNELCVSNPHIGKHKITTNINIQYPIFLRGDSFHFHSIFSNIMNNAFDALMEKDWSELESRPTINISSSKYRNNIKIDISDNGIGLPKHLPQGSIFEPFVSTKPTSGTGLGLSFVYKLIKLYDGDIQAVSKSGYTHFIVSLPIKLVIG